MNITYVEGDATVPNKIDGINILIHVVNDIGAMGSGIAASIKKKWPKVYKAYNDLFSEPAYKRLTAQGQIQVVDVGESLFVVNLFGQSGVGDMDGFAPVRYGAIEEGLMKIASIINARKGTEQSVALHMGRIGCGLAGGSWSKVEEIIHRVFSTTKVFIIVYDFPGSAFNP